MQAGSALALLNSLKSHLFPPAEAGVSADGRSAHVVGGLPESSAQMGKACLLLLYIFLFNVDKRLAQADDAIRHLEIQKHANRSYTLGIKHKDLINL